MTAKALGFARPMANSLDAVSDRDFVLETLSAAAIAAVHLSRFAEEIVIWSSPLAGFDPAVRRVHHRLLDHAAEAQSRRRRTGARQDRAARRRARRRCLPVMKGLPLAYEKDMQEDKEGVFDAVDALELSIAAMTGMVRDMEPDVDAHARGRRRGLQHRDRSRRLAGARAEAAVPRGPSHHRPHRRQAAEASVAPRRLPLAAMQEIEPRITKAVYGVLSVDEFGESRTVFGGTAPKNVRAQAKRWLKRLPAV